MNNRSQTTDQASKAGVLGIVTYLLMKANTDPALIAMAMPVIGGLLAWASTKIGDPELASFFGSNAADGKPVKVVAAKKKAPVKKAAAKK